MKSAWMVVALAGVLALGGCENNATAFSINGNHHALILVREQASFLSDEVGQSFIISQLPACQRKFAIKPDNGPLSPISVYLAGNLLWALEQRGRWYLASSEKCLLQDWDNPSGEPPGERIGRFELKDGNPVFVRDDGR